MVQLKDETKNNLIIFLLILTFFSLLGINLLRNAGDGFQSLVGGIIPYIRKLLGIVAYASGGVINTTTDIASDGARAGIDVVEGSVQSIGNLLQNASKGSISINLDKGKKEKLIRLDFSVDVNIIEKFLQDNMQKIIKQCHKTFVNIFFMWIHFC